MCEAAEWIGYNNGIYCKKTNMLTNNKIRGGIVYGKK